VLAARVSRAGSGPAWQPSRSRRLSGVRALPAPASSRARGRPSPVAGGSSARSPACSAAGRPQPGLASAPGYRRAAALARPAPALTSGAARSRRHQVGGRGCGRAHAGGQCRVGQTGLRSSPPNTPPASSTAALWSSTRPVNSGCSSR